MNLLLKEWKKRSSGNNWTGHSVRMILEDWEEEIQFIETMLSNKQEAELRRWRNENEEITKVIFRKFNDDRVIAIFPDEPYNFDSSLCMSYMHIGQHGACSKTKIDELKRAKSSEYGELFDELESIGYRLEVSNG
jgi:hypothetical protein